MRKFRCPIIVAIALTIVQFPVFGQAKKGAGGSGSSNSSAASTQSSANPSAASSTTAPIEEQGLAYEALDAVAQGIARNVCDSIAGSGAKIDGAQPIVIFDATTMANIQAYEGFLANSAAVKSAYQMLDDTAIASPRYTITASTLKERLIDSNKQALAKLSQQKQEATAVRDKAVDRMQKLKTTIDNDNARKQNTPASQTFIPNERNPDAALALQQQQIDNSQQQVDLLQYKSNKLQNLNDLLSFTSVTDSENIGSDVTSLVSAIAVASNTETPGTIVIPDSAVAVATTRELKRSCASNSPIAYPPLYGTGSTTDFSSADIQLEIDQVNTVRKLAMDSLDKVFGNTLSKETPSGDTTWTTNLTDVNGLYDSYMNSLLQVNSSTGTIGSASVIQGDQLAGLLRGGSTIKSASGTQIVLSPSYVLLASVLSAGGTEHDHKSFWTTLWKGDQISYSGGLIVNVSLWRAPDGTASTNSPIFSGVLRYRVPFTRFDDPNGHKRGDSDANNVSGYISPTSSATPVSSSATSAPATKP